jgi:ribosomal-protein-alanine N-acetyltransferase
MPGEPLFTERLRLEYLDVAHAHALLAYVARNHEHVRPWMPTHPPEETTEASIRDVIEGRVGSVRGFRTRSDDIVGSIDLLSILRGMLQSAMLGYSVDATREGRGYATEGARAVVRFAFDELNLHRVEASYRPMNATLALFESSDLSSKDMRAIISFSTMPGTTAFSFH